jgi:RES domain-containing protein
LLEVLVHQNLTVDQVPDTYQLLEIEAPDDLGVRTVVEAQLRANWQSDAAATRTIGDNWLAQGQTPLLRVPCVIVPHTLDVLINPRHPDAPRIQIVSVAHRTSLGDTEQP